MFVPLPAEVYQRKIRYILDTFESQHSKRWFREDVFSSLMRLRGMECNAPSGYAEAFYCRKLVLGLDGMLAGEQLLNSSPASEVSL